MADDNWKLEAVHEQFNVFDSIEKPFQIINSTDYTRVCVEVKKILKHKKMRFENSVKSDWEISNELMEFGDVKKEIKLSFVVIVTNIKMNGSLSKMPIFVIISTGRRIFLDVNLKCFGSWESFIKNNNLPPCQYCFPVQGQYDVGGNLKIDFASSPAAVEGKLVTKEKNVLLKGLGIIAAVVPAVAIWAGSFFFKIPQVSNVVEPLLKLAKDYAPKIWKYASCVSQGVYVVQKIKNGGISVSRGLYELGQLLSSMSKDFQEEIHVVFQKVKSVMSQLYNFLKKTQTQFKNAPESSKHYIMAITYRENEEINAAESEAKEIIEESLKSNYNTEINLVSKMHSVSVSDSADKIFQNAKNKSAVFMEEKQTVSIVNPRTELIMEISKSLAEQQDKSKIQDEMDNFEALSSVIKDEFREKIKTYAKMLKAAKAGAGHGIDIEKFNKSLGIHGEVHGHYWTEAVSSVAGPRLAYRVTEKKSRLDDKKSILILPLCEQNEEQQGAYWIVGVNGRGIFSEKELITALKNYKFEFDENQLVVNKDLSTTLMQTKDIMFIIKQQLNSENTSVGIMVVSKI